MLQLTLSFTFFPIAAEIKCGAARLDTLPALENGRIIKAPLDKEHIQFGDSIQYSCNDDYHLTGNDTIKCTENGYTELPKCEGEWHLFHRDISLCFITRCAKAHGWSAI